MTILVLRPGIETTVQDLGRPGWAHLGVPKGGAMDPEALAAANLLVGNRPEAAGLELFGGGVLLLSQRELLVARSGAAASGRLGTRPLGAQRAYTWRAGELLEIGRLRTGGRCYLAVSGGISVPLVLGSRATLLRSELGGWQGRALQRGDCLQVGPTPSASHVFSPKPSVFRTLPFRIHLLPGAHFDRFELSAKAQLVATVWRLSRQSDRIGLRLEGPPLPVPEESLQTEGLLPGSVQIFPDGQPVILGPDHPTTGGYPRLAQVARSDLRALAYLQPGDPVRFAWWTFEEGEVALRHHLRQVDDGATVGRPGV